MEDKRTLQATFTGTVSQQVGLHLLQAGQQGAAGTAGGKAAAEASRFCTFLELECSLQGLIRSLLQNRAKLT